MKTFEVTITETTTHRIKVEVTAEDWESAQDIACDYFCNGKYDDLLELDNDWDSDVSFDVEELD